METAPATTAPILEIDGLETTFRTRDGIVRAVDGVSCRVHRGEVLAIVGESGCGKSVTALSILRLIPSPPGRIEANAIRLDGVDLLDLPPQQMQEIRGNEISMIFQEPMTSLNPVLTVGRQMSLVIDSHERLSRRECAEKTMEMLRLVRIPSPKQRVREYPHQLSGGMRQRVMIAMALACSPQVLIADEPTTALDVTIQAQILKLMNELRKQLGTAVVLITHDLGVVAEMAHRVIVMYAGRTVEEASVADLFRTPRHPYTRGLLSSVPRIATERSTFEGRQRLKEIPGVVPGPGSARRGCLFAERCGYVTDRCRAETPPLAEAATGHRTACWETERVAGAARLLEAP